MPSKKKILIISVLVSFSLISSLGYLYFKKKGNEITSKTAEYLSKKTGRKTVIEKIYYSVLDGITIKNAQIKELSGEKNFLSFEKAEIKINEKEFLKGNLLFEKARFYSGKARITKENGIWNFQDLSNLLPPSRKPIHLVWNAKEISFENFDLYFYESDTGKEITLKNAFVSLSHRSSLGGNFSLSVSASADALINGKLISFEIDSQNELIYSYADLSALKTKTKLNKIFYSDISAQEALFKGEFMSLNKKEKRNYKTDLYLKDLFIPSSNDTYSSVMKYVGSVEKALGKNIAKEKEFILKEANFSAWTKDLKSEIKFSADSNLISLNFSSVCDFNIRRDEIKADLSAKELKLNFDAQSDFSKVKIKQDFSETAAEAFKKAVLDFERNILIKILGKEDL
ncbi:MAG: hypothetical protein GX447_08365 [Elusimicrobia bacterium]|nr:hypothetical protein [Elusimicrobiota bacterium]